MNPPTNAAITPSKAKGADPSPVSGSDELTVESVPTDVTVTPPIVADVEDPTLDVVVPPAPVVLVVALVVEVVVVEVEVVDEVVVEDEVVELEVLELVDEDDVELELLEEEEEEEEDVVAHFG